MSTERQAQVKEIWERVKSNHKTLNACPGPHEFVKEPGKLISPNYKCSNCGGQVDTNSYFWYTRGLQDGQILEQQRAFLEWAAENPEENQ